jgi:hypothetical protein
MGLLGMPKTMIAFQAGAYGSYLKWVLYTLLVDKPIQSPFKKSTSHDLSYLDTKLIQEGLVTKEHATIDQLLENNNLKLATIHPVTTFGMDWLEEVNKISKLVDRVIIPYIDHSTYLLGIHNYLYKIWNDMWTGALAYVNRENLEKGWGVDTTGDLNTIPRWILREHHSMNIFNSWENQCGWFAPAKFSKTNCQYVFISDLFYNFLSTIESIKQFLGVEWIRDPVELLPYHKINIANQQYKTQDIIATQILQSVSNNVNFTWNASDITLYTEAFVQRALQQQDIMLKCNGLNVFPTSTNELIEVFE